MRVAAGGALETEQNNVLVRFKGDEVLLRGC